ncbi:MAG: hypothetical protein ACSHXF_02070 [Aquaticitalea sp.]
MARQTGIVRLKGTLGGINFYDRKGEALARESGGGFNSHSAHNYPRIQEQINEMTAASIVNKAFKQSFWPLLHGYKDGTLHYRLQSLLMRIKDLDTTSIRGERRVAYGMETAYGLRLLKDFDFTPKRSVLLNGKLDFDWSQHRLTVSQFDIAEAGIPKSADVMGLLLRTVRFDFERLEFVTETSSLLELEREFDATTFELQTAPLADGDGVRFALLRVAYYQQVNGVNYLLPGDGLFGLGVVGVE